MTNSTTSTTSWLTTIHPANTTTSTTNATSSATSSLPQNLTATNTTTIQLNQTINVTINQTNLTTEENLTNVTSVVPANQPLDLPNEANVSGVGQIRQFGNGLLYVNSISTTYQQPSIGNIYINYSKLNYTATTLINIISISNTPIFLNKDYFKAVKNNPDLNSVKIYELVTQKTIVYQNVTVNTTVQSNTLPIPISDQPGNLTINSTNSSTTGTSTINTTTIPTTINTTTIPSTINTTTIPTTINTTTIPTINTTTIPQLNTTTIPTTINTTTIPTINTTTIPQLNTTTIPTTINTTTVNTTTIPINSSIVNSTNSTTNSTNSTINTTNSSILIQKQITVPIVENVTEWELLSSNAVIIAPGLNQFMIVGLIHPNQEYTWSYAFSTANAIAPKNAFDLKKVTANYSGLGIGMRAKLGMNTSIIRKSESIIAGNATIDQQTISNYSMPQATAQGQQTFSVDPVWNVPSTLTQVLNITINNQVQTRNGIIAINTPIAIPFNALNYTTYVNGQLTNYEIFNGVTGAVMYSWLEVGNSNNVNNGLIWVDLPVAIQAATNAVNVISIGFAPMTTTLMNSNNVGENPVLSPYYAEYDNGNAVFSKYCDFEGTSISTAVCPTIGSANANQGSTAPGVVTIANGIKLAVTGTSGSNTHRAYAALWTNYAVAYNAIDVWVSNQPVASNYIVIAGVIASSTSSSAFIPLDVRANVIGYVGTLQISNTLVINTQNVPYTAANVVGNAIGTSVLITSAGTPTLGNVISVYGANVYGGGYKTAISGYGGPYTNEANSISGNLLSGSYFAMYVNVTHSASANAFVSANWIRVRIPPPNDIMPIVEYGKVQTAYFQPTISMVGTPSAQGIDAGNTITFNALVSGGTPSYTYTFKIYNSITNAIINTINTGAANSYTFTTNANLIGNTVSANVFVTDGESITANSAPAGPYTINTPVSVTSLVGTPSRRTGIEVGNTITFNALAVGGTQPYTYKFNVYNSITNSILNSITISTNSYVFLANANLVGNTINANVYVTDADGNTVNSILVGPYTINSALSITIAGTPSPPAGIDAGNTITFNALVSGGTPSYTYTFKIYNSITNAIINTINTGAANSYTFTTNSNLIGNTVSANVFVTDGDRSQRIPHPQAHTRSTPRYR